MPAGRNALEAPPGPSVSHHVGMLDSMPCYSTRSSVQLPMAVNCGLLGGTPWTRLVRNEVNRQALMWMWSGSGSRRRALLFVNRKEDG
jgi:hypothetical protein